MRRLDAIAFLALVVVALVGLFDRGDAPAGPSPRRPPPAAVEPGPPRADRLAPLPGPSPLDPSFAVQVERTGPGSGTAFSIDGGGRWLTARHVVDGCAEVAIQTGPRRGVRVAAIANHPGADLSVLATRGGAPPLALSAAPLRREQDGFHFGFPQGEPGAVHATLLGRQIMRVSGRYATAEPVIAWAHRRRVPDIGPDLSGMSGGPVLDERGGLIGVVVAGAPRRGRSFSAAPESLRGALDRAAVAPAPATGDRVADQTFWRHGEELRARLTVAKVICRTEPPGRRPPGV
jgi:S1-C subfamily serine protease